LASEDYTYRFGLQLNQLVKYHKKIAKHTAELAATGTDLGGAYNAWSLTESGPTAAMAQGVEALGEAVDNTVSAYHKLNEVIEEHVTEPLLEYEKLTAAIDKILRWRHNKHVDYEQITDSLVSKKQALSKLEASEAESQRLAAVLSAEGTSGPATARAAASSRTQQQQAAGALSGSPTNGTSPINGMSSSSSDDGSASGGFKSVGVKPSYGNSTLTNVGGTATSAASGILASFNSFIDNDPEATRRANISKTRDRIVSLEHDREKSLADLGAINEAIQKDLDRFQRDKIHDLRNMLLAYAVAQRDMCRKGVEAWAEAKGSIEMMKTAPEGAGLSSIVTYEKKKLQQRPPAPPLHQQDSEAGIGSSSSLSGATF
jgi:sorting nexin-4